MDESTVDLNAVRVLVDVVNAGSISAAARKRGVPTNRLSRQVQRLETELGVRLLQRTTRRLGLTSAGRVFVDETAAAFERVDQAIRQASAQAREPRGHLRVAAPLDLFSVFAAERLAVFLARHPAVSLELLLSDEQVDLVSDGVDLALRAGVTRDENLVVRPLGQSLMLVVASPDCVAAHGAPRTLADLTAYPCVASRGRNGRAQWVLHGPQGVATVDVQAHLTVNGMGALVSAARAGLGAALVPQSFAREAMAQGALMHLLPTYHADSAGIFAVYPSRRHPNAVLQAFIDFLLGESQRAASTA